MVMSAGYVLLTAPQNNWQIKLHKIKQGSLGDLKLKFSEHVRVTTSFSFSFSNSPILLSKSR